MAKSRLLYGAGGSRLGSLEERSIPFADAFHGDTTDEWKSALKQCSAILWFLPAVCTDEIDPADAGYGRHFRVFVGHATDDWLMKENNIRLWVRTS